jgi:superfamily II DNA/RNA helicase
MSSTNTSAKSNQFLKGLHTSTGGSLTETPLPRHSQSPIHSYRYTSGGYLDDIPHIQRLMFSATLTDNPRKLSLSGVRNPLIIRTLASTPYTLTEGDLTKPEEGIMKSMEYILPTRLKEWLCVCETSSRPLYLISILYQLCGLVSTPSSDLVLSSSPLPAAAPSSASVAAPINICSKSDEIILIFTSSVETTHRLCRLLQLFNNQFERIESTSASESNSPSPMPSIFGGKIQEISRLIPANKRTEILQIARQGSVIKILISSDQLTRGIDLQNIRVVINYDSPSHPRTYVHRVGRTARANRHGDCITMIKRGNLSQFQKMRSEIASASSTITSGGANAGQGNKVSIDRVHILWTEMIEASLRGEKGKGKRKRMGQAGEDDKADEQRTSDENEKKLKEEYEAAYGQYQLALQQLNQVLEKESQNELKMGECC